MYNICMKRFIKYFIGFIASVVLASSILGLFNYKQTEGLWLCIIGIVASIGALSYILMKGRYHGSKEIYRNHNQD